MTNKHESNGGPEIIPDTFPELHAALVDNDNAFRFRTACAWRIITLLAPYLDAIQAFPDTELDAAERLALEAAAAWIGAGGVVPGLLTELARLEAAPHYDRPGIQADILRRVRAALEKPLDVRPVTEFASDPEPAPVLWKEPDPGKENDPLHGAVLRAGEVALLSGAGGIGKSTLALQIAVASAGNGLNLDTLTAPALSTAGLTVRCGPVLYASYEDTPGDMFRRARRLALEAAPKEAHESLATCTITAPESLHVAAMFGRPLFGPPPGTEGHAVNAEPGPRSAWRPLWNAAARIKAGLVVIDPAQAAFCSPGFSAQWTRLFMDAVRIEAERIGAGVLIVAHSTKAARRGGLESDPGQVSGSAAWHDAARGVLTFQRGKTDAGETAFSLHCQKANYGPSGWTLELENDGRGGAFAEVDEAAMRERYGSEAGSTLNTDKDNGKEEKEYPW